MRSHGAGARERSGLFFCGQEFDSIFGRAVDAFKQADQRVTLAIFEAARHLVFVFERKCLQSSQQRRPLICQLERVRAPVLRRDFANDKVPIFQPIDDLNQRGPVEPQRFGDRALADAGIGFDQQQRSELRCGDAIGSEFRGEFLEYRNLGKAQIEADEPRQQTHFNGGISIAGAC